MCHKVYPNATEETNKIASLETPTHIFQNFEMVQTINFDVAIEFSG